MLPFENLSADKDNAYFVDGIQDEILTRLAKISALKVIARTSTMRYASRPDNLREIAQQLGVANALEGSVQRVGDAVRVSVQLIERPKTGIAGQKPTIGTSKTFSRSNERSVFAKLNAATLTTSRSPLSRKRWTAEE